MSSVYCYHWRDLDKIQVHDICSWGVPYLLKMPIISKQNASKHQPLRERRARSCGKMMICTQQFLIWRLAHALGIYGMRSQIVERFFCSVQWKNNPLQLLWSCFWLQQTSRCNFQPGVFLKEKHLTKYFLGNDTPIDIIINTQTRIYLALFCTWYVFLHIWRSITVYGSNLRFVLKRTRQVFTECRLFRV